MTAANEARAVGGRILTRPFWILFSLLAIAIVLVGWRFLSGLGATTALNDGYPWGIWIAYDVVSGTALACGGYAVALICYVLNRGQYHPMVRPAVLASALGYSLAGIAIIIDVGRYWNLWRVPALWNWNRNSILLEVALCVMAYTLVLWIEISPAFLEKWSDSKNRLLRRIAGRLSPILNKTLILFLALGVLLPTMHHSSLGALFLIAVTKLHTLWLTSLLPLLFLSSSIAMGFSVVVFEGLVSTRVFKRAKETEMLASLSQVMVGVLGIFVVLRWADLISRQVVSLAFRFDLYSVLFLTETAMFLAPALLLWPLRNRRDSGIQFLAAILMMLAGTVYRFNVYIVAYDPGEGWSYFPSLVELFVTLGLIAFELVAYIVIVKRFPILSGLVSSESRA